MVIKIEKYSDEKQDTEMLEKLTSLVAIKDKIVRHEEGAVQRFLGDLKNASAPKQLAIGAGVGWCSGYLMMKVGKMAATAVGGTLLLLQIAHHKGYVRIDWNKMTSDSSSLADKMKDKLKIKSKSGFQKFQEFASQNIYVAGGFTGGFFLGIASS